MFGLYIYMECWHGNCKHSIDVDPRFYLYVTHFSSFFVLESAVLSSQNVIHILLSFSFEEDPEEHRDHGQEAGAGHHRHQEPRKGGVWGERQVHARSSPVRHSPQQPQHYQIGKKIKDETGLSYPQAEGVSQPPASLLGSASHTSAPCPHLFH